MRGRSYPVDLLYGGSLTHSRVEESVRSAIRIHMHEGQGDVLVFLTGSDECESAVKLTYKKL